MANFSRPSDLPVDQVRALRSRGFDNNQIVQSLQRTGYSSTQIFDALNQADLASGAPFQGMGAPSMPPPPMPSQQQPVPDQSDDSNVSVVDEQIEEIIETIVEEKWQSVAKDFQKIIEWKSDVDVKLVKMDQKIEEMRDNFDKLHQAIIGKIGEYDKNILSVGAEIKAMEKVFSKVLPVFTENVNELNRITQTLSTSGKGRDK